MVWCDFCLKLLKKEVSCSMYQSSLMEKWILVIFLVWIILVAHPSSKISASVEAGLCKCWFLCKQVMLCIASGRIYKILTMLCRVGTPTAGNPCSWFHVTCNSENSVIRVDLGNAALSGELVPELDHLKNLQYLKLFSNNITGQIPSTLGNLTNLVSLDLYSNSFTGPIPFTLGKLTKLLFLYNLFP
ncbi:hypothetical protein Patl1_27552 [Pistacia atlantica]|uniref:Uncharacterized protein n=1 Tax=Pistacia atlantica TaxID=434234 RepID=A0ACC1BFX1_9ROSI|nr:hypothetical protein Patl1_27552 [Pistacia atlantica]